MKKSLAAGIAACAFLVTTVASPAFASAKPLDGGAIFTIVNNTPVTMNFGGFSDNNNAKILDRSGDIDPGGSKDVELFLGDNDNVSDTASWGFADGNNNAGVTVHLETQNGGSGRSAYCTFNTDKYTWQSNLNDLPAYKLYIVPK
jgi:hypothetical protein